MSNSSLFSRLFNLYYNLGCVLHQQGKLSDAADSYYKAIAVQENWTEHSQDIISASSPQFGHLVAHSSPSDNSPRIQEGEIKSSRFRVLNNLACLLIQQGNWQEAAHVCRQAIELQPNHASLYNNLGQALFRINPSEAISAYCRAIELQPNLATAYHNLGIAFQHQGQHQQAISAFSRTLQLKPDHPTAHSHRAISALALGQLQQMVASFRAAILPHAQFVQAYCHQVEHLDDIDELSLVRRSCGQFLKALLDNQESAACHALAQTYLHWANIFTAYGGDEQHPYAETYYQRALQLQPRNSEILAKLVVHLIRQGRPNAAILATEAASVICSSSPQFYWHLGYSLEKQQQFHTAIHYYQKALLPQDTTSLLSALSSLNRSNNAEAFSHFPQIGTDSIDTNTDTDRTYPLLPARENSLVAGFYQNTQNWISENCPDHDFYISLQPITTQVVPTETIPCLDQATSWNAPQDKTACAGINCATCLQQIRDWFNPSQISKQLYAFSGEEDIPIDSPPLFVATIPQGRAWVVPQENVWMVCNAIAILTPDDYLLADISRAYPAHLPGCQNPNPKFHRIFTQSSLPPLETIEGNVAVLSNLSGNTYFHWLVDILPRIELLRQSGIDLSTIDWFLINGGDYAFQQETLAQLGIPAEKILSSDRHPHLQATNLIVPSFPGHFGWLEPWALSFLRREFLLPTFQNTLPDLEALSQGLAGFPDQISQWPTRIYISRSDAKYRHVLNETEVLDRLYPLGFVPIQLDCLPFQTQVALFAHAEMIVAPHGSGLTNIAFCRPGTTILELVSPHYIRYYFWVISHHLKLQHYFLVGEMLSCQPLRELMYQNPLIEDIWVNLDTLDVMLEKLDFPASTHC